MPDLPPNPELAGDLTGTPSTFSLPRCGYCTHWDQLGLIDHGTCRRIADDDDGWQPDASDAAWIASNDGVSHPVLRTLASFGCTEWTPRAEPGAPRGESNDG